MQCWYVYYKLPADRVQTNAERVRKMLASLATQTGVRAALLRKIEMQNDMVTLMEVYEGIETPTAFQSAYDQAVAAADISAEVIAARRMERFEVL